MVPDSDFRSAAESGKETGISIQAVNSVERVLPWLRKSSRGEAAMAVSGGAGYHLAAAVYHSL